MAVEHGYITNSVHMFRLHHRTSNYLYLKLLMLKLLSRFVRDGMIVSFEVDSGERMDILSVKIKNTQSIHPVQDALVMLNILDNKTRGKNEY